ncbi:MAG: glycosyltransferase [Acidobacteria bacterium]|nr:glycosyltransferase [Acidobacteriota bacterium]NIM61154.1 glycosyltransferase [Acidobacteriota bacterium]NIO58029.1 glycosyltransferase [Acidobacteriota bacterium]NIQ29036.1 glycosyltransferase [Acidobacteriota bacterium]NIQ83562.1 glycosyltransferase [Acidobacteriota bacterium]
MQPTKNSIRRPARRGPQSDTSGGATGSGTAAQTEPVAVVIVSWNSRGYLAGCLSSLRGLTRPVRQVVVVDNASTDGTPAWLAREFPEVDLLALPTNEGFCRANNLGIRRTRAPFVLVLNPDTELETGFLRSLLPAFDDPDVGLACGKLLRFDRKTLDSAGQELARSRQPLDRGYGRPDEGQYDRDEPVFGACGAAALYRRAMLESIADGDGEYFDETFFAFVEDLDLAWRANKIGWRAAYRHAAVGYHARGGTAAGPLWRRRLAAMLGHRAEVRFHVAKNRYLTIMRNDSVAGYVANIPFIWARDLGTLALLLVTSPGVLVRLWRSRPLFARARAKGRLDARRTRNQV